MFTHQQNQDNNQQFRTKNATISTTTTTTDHQHHDYNYNNNNYNTEPGVFVPPEALEMIRLCYSENIGPMTGVVAGMIEQAIQAGLKPEDIVLAIEETGMASKPSPFYLRAILRQWAEFGVTVSRTRNIVRKNEAVKWWKD